MLFFWFDKIDRSVQFEPPGWLYPVGEVRAGLDRSSPKVCPLPQKVDTTILQRGQETSMTLTLRWPFTFNHLDDMITMSSFITTARRKNANQVASIARSDGIVAIHASSRSRICYKRQRTASIMYIRHVQCLVLRNQRLFQELSNVRWTGQSWCYYWGSEWQCHDGNVLLLPLPGMEQRPHLL